MTFSLRSSDDGLTWEKRPTLIPPSRHRDQVIVANFPMVRFANGVFAVAAVAHGGALPGQEGCLYLTDNDGLTWDYLQTIAVDLRGIDGYTYPSLLRLANGRMLCVMLRRNGLPTNTSNWPCACFSDDDGMRWSEPRAIVRPSQNPWPAYRREGEFDHPPAVSPDNFQPATGLPEWEKPMYRSPYALQLRDGRIVVFLTRRKPPAGMSFVGAKMAE